MADINPDTPEILFMRSLKHMLRSVGIHKMHEAMDYFRLMEEAVHREIFNRQNPCNAARYKESRSRQAFIAIFQSRYRTAYGIDYEAPISERDAGSLSKIVKKLEDDDIPLDIYLEWFFEEFLKNRDLSVETISFPCSLTVYQSFKMNNRGVMDKIREKKIEERRKIELFEKAKEIIRTSKVLGQEDMAKDVVENAKAFNNGLMTTEAFREYVMNKIQEIKKIKDRNLNAVAEKQEGQEDGR